ncbi:Chaperone DnaJ-domain superfamily protein [Zea mays]|uniref:Chaperone DnaJ-domain superfamily protein n=1 Tax=Zea mays TaxID=4577 RepID=A0A1D6IAD3_MAIZE|nr:Chaperone DnaJ-domain superfamily protein [Zea mays]
MNSIKSAIFSGHRSHPHVGAAAVPQQQLGSTASFHSTPILQRKHKTQWHNRFNYYTRRRRNRETKRSMLRNMSEYAESLFQNQLFIFVVVVRHWGGFEFCTSDEDEPENLFRNVFRDQHTYYWSFSSDNFQRNSKRARSQKSRNWSFETDEEDEVSAPSEVSLARQALGLSTSGPLKLEDVKSAYRACALRWHPDRHNGSSKVLTQHAQGTTVW